MEACCAALATEDRKSGGALVSSEWGKVGNVPLPLLDGLKQEVEEIEGPKAEPWPGFGGLRCDIELARPWRSTRRRGWLGSSASARTERRRRRKWMKRRVVDVVAACRRLRPDRWDRGQRTGATARPRGVHGLRPVGHSRLKKLNSTESQVQ
jgi:hypothetical protein